MARPTLVRSPLSNPLEGLVKDFLEDAAARGVSRKTQELYGASLARLMVYCRAEGITDPDQLTGRVLNAYTNALRDRVGARGRPLSLASVHSYTRPINHFLRWGGRDPEADPEKGGANISALRAVRAKLPTVKAKKLAVLSREEIRDMEDAATGERDKLMIRTLGDSGIRLGELLGLTPADLIGRPGPKASRFLQVRGKTGQRDVPISPALYERLRRYAAKTRPKDTSSDQLFLANRRDPRTKLHEPLTESGAEQMVRLTAAAAGIERRVYPHLFRHSAITRLVKAGKNPILVAKIAGHSSLKMIQEVYSHIEPEDTYDAMMESLRDD